MKRLGLLLLLAAPAFAQRSLSWDELAVRARLDDRGALHIVETQTYVMNGDWNGGERIFRLERGHELTVNGVSKRAENGTLVPLQRGSLSVNDQWDMADRNTLRWRSRMPGDPEFRNTRLTYVLDYTLENVLLRRGSSYTLAHDFAFSERDGEIRRFVLDLGVDPVWQSDLPRHVERTSLPPGTSVVVRGRLEFRGDVAPEARFDWRWFRYGLAALLLLGSWILWRKFVEREERLGRFAPLVTSTITPQWIAENVLPIRAEVVGAAWDEEVAANEVSALIARWAAEGKVKSSADGKNLKLTLFADRESFDLYERILLDKLFFNGDTTSTDRVKEKYKQTGFNPANLIQRDILVKAEELTKSSELAPPVSRTLTFTLFLVTIVLAFLGGRAGDDNTFFVFFLLWVFGLGWGASCFLAVGWRARVDRLLRDTLVFRIPLMILLTVVVLALVFDWFNWWAKLALATAALMIVNNTLNQAKSKRGAPAIAYRKRLASVRQYFIDELRTSDPALEDRWFPYVIAFGLDDHASAWMRDFGGARARSSSSFGSSSSSSSSSSTSSQWTGGGGAFGGAGATGTWTAAAAGMAAGVASPSSSSGGGGGGSSSGGGGGGGW